MPDQVTELRELLHEFPQLTRGKWQLTSGKLERTDVLEQDVNVGDAPPFRQQPYQVPLAMRHTMERELDKMLQLYQSRRKMVNFRAVWNQRTGLLDWDTGLEYWNGLNCCKKSFS